MAAALLFVRHGRTDWNDSRRLQGHHDIDLNEFGRTELAACRVPAQWDGASWCSSPLKRAVHSARLLGGTTLRCDALLSEMDWGEWSGRTLASLREELGDTMRDNEARGLDFRADGGESPRDVCQRLQSWLSALPTVSARNNRRPEFDRRYVVVTHKGMIRAALSLATGWPMLDAFVPRLNWLCGHEFALDDDARFTLTRVNVPLLRDGS
ncbi:MAG: putative phosphoglycerate mutase [Gammaproteobacteria bacterium]